MAATSNLIIIARRLADLGKPLPVSSPSPFAFSRRFRAGHWAAYEKNLEEEICPTIVPDHMIHPLSENYWAPDPQTGVFGPPAHHSPVPNDASAAGRAREESSILNHKVWFRHSDLEDPEK